MPVKEGKIDKPGFTFYETSSGVAKRRLQKMQIFAFAFAENRLPEIAHPARPTNKIAWFWQPLHPF